MLTVFIKMPFGCIIKKNEPKLDISIVTHAMCHCPRE